MGNQCSGLRDKAQLDCIRGANSKQKNTETMDTSVRLSKDQIAKISEYHQRFIKENNPTAVFFNLDDEFKVDQGGSISSRLETSSKQQDSLKFQDKIDYQQKEPSSHQNLDIVDRMSSSRSSSLRKLLKLEKENQTETEDLKQSQPILHLDRPCSKTEDDNTEIKQNEDLEVTKPKYEEYKDESEFCNSFGDPNFKNSGRYNRNMKLNLKGQEGCISSSIKIVDYDDSNQNVQNKKKYLCDLPFQCSKFQIEQEENLGENNRVSDFSVHKSELNDEINNFNKPNYNDEHISSPENSSNRFSKPNTYVSGDDENMLKSESSNISPFYKEFLSKFVNQKCTETESINIMDIADDNDAYHSLKGSTSNFDPKNFSKKDKGVVRMADTSTIELNNSHDFSEFDDILNSLNREFTQRKTKRFNNVFKSYEL